MEISKEFLQQELKGVDDEIRRIQDTFQRLVGIKQYVEELLKKLELPVVDEKDLQVDGIEANENKG